MAPSHRHLALWLLLMVAPALACGDGGERGQDGAALAGDAVLGGEVVSTVDGHAITIAQVKELAQAGGLSPRQALRRLQDELVLMGEAQRRGFASHPEVRHVGRRALVQSLLEEEAAGVQVSEAQLRERYEAAGSRFNALERRKSVHVLCRVAKEGPTPEEQERARECAQELLPTLRQGETPKQILRTLRGERERVEAKYGLKMVVEALPAVDLEAAFAKPYLDAIFSVDEAGTLPEPVQTSFGWHAIRVLEIEPPVHVPFEDARAELEEEALLEGRTGSVRELVKRLRGSSGVQLQDDARDALASWSRQ